MAEISKVLVVEDEEDIRSGLVELLKKSYSVHEAASGAEAVEKAVDLFPYLDAGIVLLDIKLPDLSGLEVLKKIKEHDPALSVIMVTAMKDTKLAVEAMDKGASDYITKPFDPEELLSKMKRMEDASEALRQLLWFDRSMDRWRADMDLRQSDARQFMEKMRDAGLPVTPEDFKEIMFNKGSEDTALSAYTRLEQKIRSRLNREVRFEARTPKVLIVEDEDDMRSGLTELVRSKYPVDCAATAAEAESKFKKGEFDVVLLDIKLPDMNGIELLERIKRTDPSVYVIMVTAMKDISLTVDAMKAGAVDFITKPFENKHLLETIQRQLDLKNSRERLEVLRRELDKGQA